MKEFAEKLGKNWEFYYKIALKIKENIIKYFWDGSGWLLSATGICRQHDVVGTVFAIYSGIIEEEFLKKSLIKVSIGTLNAPPNRQLIVHHFFGSTPA